MAARPYNPDRPCVIGSQFLPVGNFATPIQSLNALGVQVTATTTDTIDALYTALLNVIPLNSAMLALEIIDITNGAGPPALPALDPELASTFLPGISNPNFGSAAWGYNAGSVIGPAVPNSETYVDQSSLTPGFFHGVLISANKFLFSARGETFDSAFQFDSVVGTTPGRWITRIQTRATVSCIYAAGGSAGTGGSSIAFVPFIVIGGAQYFGFPQSISSFQPDTTVIADWFVNPVNGLPWTDADIDLFDSTAGTGNYAGFVAIGVGNPSSFAIVEQFQLLVFSSANDPRLAIGIVEVNHASGLGQGWSRIRFRDQADGTLTNFALTIGNTYLFQLRETRDLAGSIGINRVYAQRLPSGAAPIPDGPPFISCSNVALDPVSHRPMTLLPADGTLPPFVLQTTAPGISADSQPYAWDTAVQGGATGFTTVPNGTYHFSEVSFGQWLHQEFTIDTLTTFGYLAVVCSLLTTTTDDAGTPLVATNPLIINIRLASTDALIAGPFTINQSDLVSPVTGWQIIGLDIGAVVLAPDQYYWDVTSAASPFTSWQVQVAITGLGTPPSGPPAGTEDVTWGAGIDDLVIFNFGVPTIFPAETALIYLGERPDTPDPFTAVPLGESTCHLDGIVLTWGQPALTCGEHGTYDLQRSDDAGTTWHSIAAITDPTVTEFTDYESIRNTVASYRLRIIRVDGTPSLWTATVTATAAFTGTGLLLVSNEFPLYNIFYPDLGGKRSLAFPQRVQVNAPYGRAYQIVLHNLEYQGRTFSRRLGVKSGIPGCPPQLVTCDDQTLEGDAVFGPLQQICRADLSYVCIHDEHGNRYFANATSTAGEWHPTRHEVFYSDLIAVEVTDVPSTPDAAPSGS